MLEDEYEHESADFPFEDLLEIYREKRRKQRRKIVDEEEKQ